MRFFDFLFRKKEHPLVGEANFYANLIRNRLTKLGLCYSYKDERGRNVTEPVEFIEPIIASEEWIKVEVDITNLPRGIDLEDLREPHVVETLAGACRREIEVKYARRSGFWYIIYRGDKRDEIPTKFAFSELVAPSKPGIAIPFGMGKRGQVWDSVYSCVGILVGGAARQGKSNFLHAVICHLIRAYTPEQVRLVLIDLKQGVELSIYQTCSHLLQPVITDVADMENALSELIEEGERRFNVFNSVGVRNIVGYNYTRALDAMPYIVLIVDELAVAMLGDHKSEIEPRLADLAARMPGAGIHCIIATQRPTVNVVTGLIKANLLTRVAFRCSSSTDSQVILDCGDAASLLPNPGRCLVNLGADLLECQAPLIHEDEIKQILSNSQQDVENNAVEWETKKHQLLDYAISNLGGSFSRSALAVAFAGRITHEEILRAGRELEEAGILAPAAGRRPRRVINAAHPVAGNGESH